MKCHRWRDSGTVDEQRRVLACERRVSKPPECVWETEGKELPTICEGHNGMTDVVEWMCTVYMNTSIQAQCAHIALVAGPKKKIDKTSDEFKEAGGT